MDNKTSAKPKETAKGKSRHKKKSFCIVSLLFVLILVIGVSVSFYVSYTKTHYRISFYQETSKKVSDNIRIVVVSDIHNREYGENNKTLISDIRGLKPDLILFPGDMVIRDEDDYQPMLDLVSALTGIAPCYGVLGNHESERIYYGDDKELPDKFKNAGLRLLRNAREDIQIGRDTVQLIGVEGTSYGFEEYGGREFMDKTEIDPSDLCILMNHIPILFDKQLSGYDFDLGIGGHVHGGIIVLPVIGGLYTEEEGFFPEFTYGKYILDTLEELYQKNRIRDFMAKSYEYCLDHEKEIRSHIRWI